MVYCYLNKCIQFKCLSTYCQGCAEVQVYMRCTACTDVGERLCTCTCAQSKVASSHIHAHTHTCICTHMIVDLMNLMFTLSGWIDIEGNEPCLCDFLKKKCWLLLRHLKTDFFQTWADNKDH